MGGCESLGKFNQFLFKIFSKYCFSVLFFSLDAVNDAIHNISTTAIALSYGKVTIERLDKYNTEQRTPVSKYGYHNYHPKD